MVYNLPPASKNERMSIAEASDLDRIVTELAKDPAAAEQAWLILKSADHRSPQELKTAFAHITKEFQMPTYHRLKQLLAQLSASK